MKKYDEFINEVFTDKQEAYHKLVSDLFYDKGFNTWVNYDTQGYMMVNAKFQYENTKDIFTKNLSKFQEMLKFINEMNGIAVQTLETNRNKKIEDMGVDFTFDFRDMDNLDPYFVSLLGINKYKL